VGQSKGSAIALGSGKDFDGGDSRLGIWSVVVKICSMVQGEGPKGFIINFRPVKSNMHHHGSGSGDCHPNGILSNSVLPLGSNCTELDGLVVALEGVDVVSALVDAIVSVVRFHNNAVREGQPFVAVLGHDGVSCIGGNLMLKVDESSVAIIEDRGC
jgi:hypothetical protein